MIAANTSRGIARIILDQFIPLVNILSLWYVLAMEIVFLGHACFKIRGRTTDWVNIITDPFDPGFVGLSFPKVAADIITVSHEHKDHNGVEQVTGMAKVLRGPGEYEVRGVGIVGVATWHDKEQGRSRGENTIFVITLEGIRVAHLGDLGHKLTDNELSQIGSVDILFIPVGGFYTIDAQTALEVVGQLEPRIVIPMHYQEPGLKPEIFEKLAEVGDFIKVAGITLKRMPSLSVKKETIPEEMEVVVLERKG